MLFVHWKIKVSQRKRTVRFIVCGKLKWLTFHFPEKTSNLDEACWRLFPFLFWFHLQRNSKTKPSWATWKELFWNSSLLKPNETNLALPTVYTRDMRTFKIPFLIYSQNRDSLHIAVIVCWSVIVGWSMIGQYSCPPPFTWTDCMVM